MIIAVAGGLKSALFVVFLVLLPTVPLTMWITGRLRRPGERSSDVVEGRSSATPFVLITVLGTGIAAVVFVALLVAIGAQWLVRSGGEHTDPLVGNAGGPPSLTTTDAQVPEQGNAAAGKKIFVSSRCGSCHTLADAGARGTVGPDLDDGQPDFSRVVECVTTGPGDMPAFAQRLSNADIRNVAKYVSTIAGNPQTPDR